MEKVELSLADAITQVWKKCFSVHIHWVGTFTGCVEIGASSSGQITITVDLSLGSHHWRWSFSVSGNKCWSIGVIGPVKLEACVSEWSIDKHSASFRLKVTLMGITLFNEKITIPLMSAEELEALESASPEDLVSALAVLGAEVREVPVGIHFDGSDSGCHCGKGV
jgi:hypothetical protein